MLSKKYFVQFKNPMAALLLGVAVILLLHRMLGIEHDARLYMAQGFLFRYPDIFSQDLFFLYGSQDKYTIFPWLLGNILFWLDPFPVFKLGTLLGLLFFAFSSWYCLKILLPSRECYIAWIGVLCLPSSYAVVSIFSYIEPFFTARIFSVSLCLFAIAFVIQRKWWSTALFLFFSGLLHPIQTLVTLPVIWLWLIAKQRLWWHIIWLIIPVMALSLAEVHPLDGLFKKMDPFWLSRVKTSKHLLISHWEANDFNNLIFDIFILTLAWRRLPLPWNTWCRAALIALILGVVSSLVLVDWLNLILPTSLQLWRVHWVAHWFAMASVTLFLLQHWQIGQWHQSMLLILIICLIWSGINWIWLILMLIYILWLKIKYYLRQHILTLLGGLFSLVLIFLYVWKVSIWLHILANKQDKYLPMYTVDFYLICFPAVAIGLPLLGIYLWNRLNDHKRWILVLVLLSALLWGWWQWDSRSEMQRAILPLNGHSDVFGVSIPEDAQVQIYSEKDKDMVGNSALLSWYILRRAHYFSYTQVSGLVFNRETAWQGYQRWRRLKILEEEVVGTCLKAIKENNFNCHIKTAALYHACNPSIPDLPAPPDYLVLPFNQPQTALGQWSIHNTKTGEWMITYYLYSCAGLMEELQVEMEEKEDNITVELSS